MLTWMIRRRLAAFERTYGYDVSYLREMLAVDLGAFFRFARVSGISSYRKDVPLDAYYAAKLTAAMSADCGPCTQLVVGLGLHDGLAPAAAAAIIAGDETAMSRGAVLAARFARAVIARDPEADVWREQIERQWGKRAVLSLGFALVAAQVYPTLKYALGHGHACTHVVIEGKAITPRMLAHGAA